MAKRTPEIIAEARRRQKLFEKTRGQILRDYRGVKDKEIRRIINMLNDTRKQVLAGIASSDWNAHYIPQLLDAIDNQIETFSTRAAGEVVGVQQTFWEKGQMLVDDPLLKTGISIGLPELSTTVIENLKTFSVDLIKNLSNAAKARIKQEIQIGFLGGKTPFDVMEAVGRNLKDPSVFRTIATRSEAIVRTEYGRAFSKAGQMRMEQANDFFVQAHGSSPLRKEWRWSGKQRQEHAMIDGQTRKVNEDYDIPLPEGSTVEGSFPRDPKLPPVASVNCGCESLPLVDGWEDIVSKQNSALAV